ncbi:MAG: acyl carrier protein [Clostridiales bacterium]|nr:acyl carrier protein [Clostridiales bacterium]
MNKAEVLEKVIAVFARTSEAEEVRADSELLEDLELSSIDIFMILVELEDMFGVKISENDVRGMATVEDVCDIVLRLM